MKKVEDEIEALTLLTPDHPLTDMNLFLGTFIYTKGAEITIYIDQPIAGQADAFTTGEEKAGHAFIGVKQENVVRMFGLYPDGKATPYTPNDPHRFGNDSFHSFDVSITFSIGSLELWNIVDNAINYNLNYDLNSNNCTDYVLNVANIAGYNLPDPQSTWINNGGGSNPGAFGEAIRNMNLPDGMTRDIVGGIANPNN